MAIILLRSSLLKNSSKTEAFTSGTIKGTLSCILKCEVLSITRQPAFAALGANSADTLPPGEKRPICTLEKSNSARSSTINSSPLNSIACPFDREDANKYN